jgi:hypothetical protein
MTGVRLPICDVVVRPSASRFSSLILPAADVYVRVSSVAVETVFNVACALVLPLSGSVVVPHVNAEEGLSAVPEYWVVVVMVPTVTGLAAQTISALVDVMLVGGLAVRPFGSEVVVTRDVRLRPPQTGSAAAPIVLIVPSGVLSVDVPFGFVVPVATV